MQACVLTFTTPISTGVQTVTGVVDKDGNAFVGKLFLFQGGYATLNTVTSEANGGFLNDYGIAYGTTLGNSTGGGDYAFGTAKIASGAVGGRYSVMDTRPNVFFGGAIDGYGYITDVRSGEFDITWDYKVRGGDTRMVVVLGGSDLNTDVSLSVANGAVSTTAAPVAVLELGTAGDLSTLGTATGAGGTQVTWGWDTKNSGRGAVVTSVVNQGPNYRYQTTDKFISSLTALGAITGGTPIVSTWGASSFTISGVSAGLGGSTKVAFSGTGIEAAAGTLTQPGSATSQTVNCGINPKWVMLASVGTEASAGVDSTRGEIAIGWFDGTNQAGYWTAEDISGNGSGVDGARYISDSTALRFGSPADSSTSFDAIAEFVSFDETGSFTINWTTSDGTPREVHWFVLGEAALTHPTLEVEKVWTDTVGSITLQIGTTEGGAEVASTTGTSLGPVTLTAGTYYVSETDTGGLYSGTLTATINGVAYAIPSNGQITVTNDDVAVVTITNTPVTTPVRPKQWKLYQFTAKIRREETR